MLHADCRHEVCLHGSSTMNVNVRSILLAVIASVAPIALAQPAAPPAATAADLHPQQHSQNGTNYLCGGIGAEEAAYMKERARQYGLMLTFATRDGSYLADVDVDIRDAHGRPVLTANCDGPIMLVDLPAGATYRVHAETGGYVLDRSVHVNAYGHGRQPMRMAMVWPGAAGGEGATATGDSGNRPASASGDAHDRRDRKR
jgi:hypothetical protein